MLTIRKAAICGAILVVVAVLALPIILQRVRRTAPAPRRNLSSVGVPKDVLGVKITLRNVERIRGGNDVRAVLEVKGLSSLPAGTSFEVGTIQFTNPPGLRYCGGTGQSYHTRDTLVEVSQFSIPSNVNKFSMRQRVYLDRHRPKNRYMFHDITNKGRNAKLEAEGQWIVLRDVHINRPVFTGNLQPDWVNADDYRLAFTPGKTGERGVAAVVTTASDLDLSRMEAILIDGQGRRYPQHALKPGIGALMPHKGWNDSMYAYRFAAIEPVPKKLDLELLYDLPPSPADEAWIKFDDVPVAVTEANP